MIVITGAAGFIGWNIYQSLKHVREIVLVDFTHKFDGLLTHHEIIDPFEFLEKIKASEKLVSFNVSLVITFTMFCSL